jgi:hypothetical protein
MVCRGKFSRYGSHVRGDIFVIRSQIACQELLIVVPCGVQSMLDRNLRCRLGFLQVVEAEQEPQFYSDSHLNFWPVLGF